MTQRKKLIEVALPLEAINVASAREKSIRHGHPSTLHLWWARRPLAAARAVIFASLVDDPDSPDAPRAFVDACRALPVGANVHANGDTPRMRLFDFIERLVTWEATTDEAILTTARELIRLATDGNPPPLLDPFAGGGSIPLEAQRLGLEAHASDLNPVAVMINKAQIEIPPRFANLPPVNPRDRASLFAPTPNPSPIKREGNQPAAREGNQPAAREGNQDVDKWELSPELERRMQAVARELRKDPTPAEETLWQAIRKNQLDGRKFRRQVAIGAFVVDFYCPSERLAVEVDGAIHQTQRDADRLRQELIESLGIRFVRVTNDEIAGDLSAAVEKIRAAFLPSLPVGEGPGVGGSLWRGAAGLAADVRYYGEWMRAKAWERIGHLYPKYYPHPQSLPQNEGGKRDSLSLPVGERAGDRGGETVIAWLWARTVKSPNPAVNAHVPLVRSFILSKKKGRECWAKPVIQGNTVRFEVTPGNPPKDGDGTVVRTGGRCILSGEPIPFEYIRAEGKAGRMCAMLMAIVTEGKSGRNYYAPTQEHAQIAENAKPEWKPSGDIPEQALGFRVQLYGMDEYSKLFTPRQLVALTTFSDLVAEARAQAHADALNAGLPDDCVPLREGGRGALAYAEAVSVYLAFAVDKLADYNSSICSWHSGRDTIRNTFGRQAIPMVWDYSEINPFSDSTGNWLSMLEWGCKVLEYLPGTTWGYSIQHDAAQLDLPRRMISTDPPYYDNIGYADLSDYFYVWMRKNLRDVYPDIFGTLLVPKEPELVANTQRHGGREAANAHFEGGMLQTFSNIRRFISHDYPLTVYYAFKQQDVEAVEDDGEDDERTSGIHSASAAKPAISSTGWETMLTSLIDSGFSIDGTWPMRTELNNRMRNLGSNALASSIVLVCRPRPQDAPTTSRRAFLDALRRELPAALKAMQSGNIAPVDLAQASIGPGMAIYSRYSQVLEADGSPMSVRTALGLINAALDEYLAEQDGDIDADTRFAVDWFSQMGFNEGGFGVADVLARAKNTSVDGVKAAGLVLSERGKVRLKHWSEYDPGAWDPAQDKRATVWEATHHLIERLKGSSGGETGSALLMTKMPSAMAAEARQLAYRLYSICERKGWAEHARDYNALVVSWSEIGDRAAALRNEAEAGDRQQQTGLPGFER